MISDIYFHARSKEGRIEIPAPVVEAAGEPETEAAALADLALLRQLNLITPENHAECVAATRRKFRGTSE